MDSPTNHEGFTLEEGGWKVRRHDDHRVRELVLVPCVVVLGPGSFHFITPAGLS